LYQHRLGRARPRIPRLGAWGEKETLLPVEAHGKTERIPQASIKTLPGVSHVPMIDDPGLVARTILAGTGAAKN